MKNEISLHIEAHIQTRSISLSISDISSGNITYPKGIYGEKNVECQAACNTI